MGAEVTLNLSTSVFMILMMRQLFKMIQLGGESAPFLIIDGKLTDQLIKKSLNNPRKTLKIK